MRTNCTIPDCDSIAFARTWCQMHYMRWWKHGDPDTVQRKVSKETRAHFSAVRMGHSVSSETRDKLRVARRGYVASSATRERLSLAGKGRHFSAATRAKIGATKVGNTYMLGRKRSEETKARLSASLGGKNMGNKNARSVSAGSTHSSNGYTEIKTASGWQKEHRVVTGLKPGDGKIAHHKDGDKTNNAPSNLRVFESRAAHARHHMKERLHVEATH